MTFACKKCKKCFRKDVQEFEESDEYCPHCDNHFVLDAVTAKPRVEVEGEDARVDSRYFDIMLLTDRFRKPGLMLPHRMLKDERVRQGDERSVFDVKDAPNKLG